MNDYFIKVGGDDESQDGKGNDKKKVGKRCGSLFPFFPLS